MPEGRITLTGPEQLDSYIKVTNPSVWVLLSAVLVLLIAMFCWVFWGTVEITLALPVYTDESASFAFVRAEEAVLLRKGMQVRIGGVKGEIQEVSRSSAPLEEILARVGELSAETMNVLQSGRLYMITMKADGAPQGVAGAVVVRRTMSPASLLR